MKKVRVTYLALVASLSAVSCSKETAEPDVYDWADGKIYFRPTVSLVTGTRAQDMTLERLESFQVTCFNSPDVNSNAGFGSPYFENATFIRKDTPSAITAYVSSPAEGPREWPSDGGFLRFFAFSPTLPALGNGQAALRGNSTGYRLSGMHINPDISQQVDFITAEAAGDRWKDFAAGVEIGFSHRLCQVELNAWGNSGDYDFEIAGVRIGNPVVEGTFIFTDSSVPESACTWTPGDQFPGSKVEYIYRPFDDRTGDTDKIYRINSSEHNTPEKAGSIMGMGGCAMVIPTANQRWEGLEDPEIGQIPYTTQRMYFSILMRVTSSGRTDKIYPYPGNPDNMEVVWLAVDSTGNIIHRLYTAQAGAPFYTDKELQHPYTPAPREEIRDFGWATVPVDADWKAGKRYVYTLDYSKGIGLHDPDDPDPGRPIGPANAIKWGVSVDEWKYAVSDSNYQPDLNVPKR